MAFPMKRLSTTGLHVAVFGCGYWGSKIVRVLSSLGLTDRLTAVDIDKHAADAMRRTFPGISVSDRPESVLHNPAVSCVFIATPPLTHYRLATGALQSGKHVFIEKPMTVSVAEARKISEQQQKTGLVVAVDHTYLFDPAIRKIRDLLDSGALGHLWFAESERSHFGVWRTGENVSWDLAVHDISILRFLFRSDPVSVRATEPVSRKISRASVHAELQFPGSKTAYIHASWLSPERVRKFSVTGPLGSLIFTESAAGRKLVFRHTSVSFSGKTVMMNDGGSETVRFSQTEPLALSIADFITSAAGNTRPAVSSADGYAVVRVLEALDASVRMRGKQVLLRR